MIVAGVIGIANFLGLDFGLARIGVARNCGTLAVPVGVVPYSRAIHSQKTHSISSSCVFHADFAQRILNYIQQFYIDEVVIGLPLTLKGAEKESAKNAKVFAEFLRTTHCTTKSFQNCDTAQQKTRSLPTEYCPTGEPSKYSENSEEVKTPPKPLRVTFFDERFTTVIAMQKFAEIGKTAKQVRKSVDGAAAAVMLQLFLDRAASAKSFAESQS